MFVQSCQGQRCFARIHKAVQNRLWQSLVTLQPNFFPPSPFLFSLARRHTTFSQSRKSLEPLKPQQHQDIKNNDSQKLQKTLRATMWRCASSWLMRNYSIVQRDTQDQMRLQAGKKDIKFVATLAAALYTAWSCIAKSISTWLHQGAEGSC